MEAEVLVEAAVGVAPEVEVGLEVAVEVGTD